MNEEERMNRIEELDDEIITLTEQIDVVHAAANDPNDDTPLTVIVENFSKLYEDLSDKRIKRERLKKQWIS